jgi:hypothetical protein
MRSPARVLRRPATAATELNGWGDGDDARPGVVCAVGAHLSPIWLLVLGPLFRIGNVGPMVGVEALLVPVVSGS